jgi:hypothetical protein
MLNLPGQYTKEIWKRGGSKKEHKKFIGKPYVSWSTCESFNDKAGFNTGLLGEFEWMLNKLTNIVLVEGENKMTITGAVGTTINFEYQEGAL